MAYGFLDIASTDSVKAAQSANGSLRFWLSFNGDRACDRFTEQEAAFIAARDNFYLATVSETGWPYVQHRGGPTGFLQMLDDRTLALPDFRGNRQYISLGNLGANDRAALILVDYSSRRRLKIYARAEVVDLAAGPEPAFRFSMSNDKGKSERAIKLRLESYDWNCPQHITPRFTEAEFEQALAPMRSRLAALESECRMLRETLAQQENDHAG